VSGVRPVVCLVILLILNRFLLRVHHSQVAEPFVSKPSLCLPVIAWQISKRVLWSQHKPILWRYVRRKRLQSVSRPLLGHRSPLSFEAPSLHLEHIIHVILLPRKTKTVLPLRRRQRFRKLVLLLSKLILV
jgi:hypothetical protein